MTMTNHDLQTETFDHHQHARPLAIRFLAALEMTLGWVRWDSAAGVILVRCYPVIPSAAIYALWVEILSFSDVCTHCCLRFLTTFDMTK